MKSCRSGRYCKTFLPVNVAQKYLFFGAATNVSYFLKSTNCTSNACAAQLVKRPMRYYRLFFSDRCATIAKPLSPIFSYLHSSKILLKDFWPKAMTYPKLLRMTLLFIYGSSASFPDAKLFCRF